MHILVATSDTQGDEPTDACSTYPGEVVTLPLFECACAHCADECGCTRSFIGLSSLAGTTTAEVADRPDLDPDGYRALLFAGATDLGIEPDAPHLDHTVFEIWETLTGLAARQPVGTVIGRNRHHFGVRRLGPIPA